MTDVIHGFFEAHARTCAEYTLSDRTLSVAGFAFDKILWKSDTFSAGCTPLDPAQAVKAQNPTPISQIWLHFGKSVLRKGTIEAIAIALCAPLDERRLFHDSSDASAADSREKLASAFLAYSLDMGIDVPEIDPETVDGDPREFALSGATDNRCFFVTERGWIGSGPLVSFVGDEVCIFLGGQTPFVVRELPSASESIYKMCGPCYVHGIMYGEAVAMCEGEHFESKTFNLV